MSHREVGVAVAVASAAREGLKIRETLHRGLARESLESDWGDLVCSITEVKRGVEESRKEVEKREGRRGITGAPSRVEERWFCGKGVWEKECCSREDSLESHF
jgi:hypothetical protein